jgi:hypothetical protein
MPYIVVAYRIFTSCLHIDAKRLFCLWWWCSQVHAYVAWTIIDAEYSADIVSVRSHVAHAPLICATRVWVLYLHGP